MQAGARLACAHARTGQLVHRWLTTSRRALRCLQVDIEDMIWEVDDDCDKCVTWSEFQAMFSRCRNDKTGVPLCCSAESATQAADCEPWSN